MEKEIKARTIKDEFPSRGYKKRKLNELSYKEIDKIVSCYLTEPLTQKEVARKFRISSPLVSKLYCQHKKDPDKDNLSLMHAESDKQTKAITLPAKKREQKDHSLQEKKEIIK